MLRYCAALLSLCLIGFVVPKPAYATLPQQVIYDLRPTGNDNNGAGFISGATGTDRSQSDSAFCNATDLVLVTTTTATSATCPFSSASVGNLIHVTAGTNFTVQRCAVMSVATVTATLQCEASTAGTGGATGGTFFLGGAALTAQSVITSMDGTFFPFLYVKTGTYTRSSAISIGPNGQGPEVEGYISTHGDLHNVSSVSASAPVWTTATDSINLVIFTSGDTPQITFRQMVFSTTAATPGHGFYPTSARPGTKLTFDRCKFSGFDYAIDGDFNGGLYWSNLYVLKSEFTATTQVAVRNAGTNWLVGNNFHDNVGSAYVGVGAGNFIPTTMLFNIFNHNNTGAGGSAGAVLIATSQGGGEPAGSFIFGNVFFNNVSNSLNINGGANEYVVINNIFEGNVGAATTALLSTNGNSDNTLYTSGNSYHNNTANISCAGGGYVCTDSTDVFPSVSPLTSPGSNDFTLNSTAGGGALLKGVGYIGVIPLGGTGISDIGALQSGTGGAIATVCSSSCVQ